MSKAKDIAKTIGVNTGDETATTIKATLGITTLSGSNTGDQVIPTTLPASDVYPWAKAATKPVYTYVEVGAQVAGDYITGTGSASGVNTGDETAETIKTALGITTLSGSNTGDETATSIKTALGITTLSGSNTGDETAETIKTALGITTLSGSNTGDQTLPTTLPASDVYAWAKAATKPAYTYTEVGAQVAGTYATGTGSASGVNTGDETATSIKTALGITTLSGSNTGDQTTISGNAGTATSIAGQTTNGVLYQSGSGVTASTLASTVAGQVLTTTTLGGVPTWETPSAGGGGVAGTTGQVQYNNAGAMAGASYVKISGGHLNMSDAGAIPATPAAGTLTYFAEDHAGRMLPSVIGPSGVDLNLQSALFGSTTYMWLAGTSTTTAIAWGTSFAPLTNAGTGTVQATPSKTSTNAISSLNRATFSTGSTATGVCGIIGVNSFGWLGNAAGLGGFLFFTRFGLETVSGTYGCFVGLSNSSVTLPAEPSTLINSIALVKDTADTNWFLSTRGATSAAKTDTGILVTVGQILDLFIHSAPNSQSVKAEIKDALTGATLYVTPTAITATLPANNLFLNGRVQIRSVTGTTPKLIALNRMYCETDL